MAPGHGRGDDGAAMRSPGVTITPFPASRRLVLAAMRAGRRQAPIHGLLSLDVTEARSLLARCNPPPSFTAYMLACVGRAAAAHPAVHAYRNWRGNLVMHDHVDVAALIETEVSDGRFPMAHLVRDTHVRSVTDISREIRTVQSDTKASRSGALLARFGRLGSKIPGFWSLMYSLMRRSVRMRRMTGTVSVTSVGMFAGGGGHGIGFPTVLSLGVLVGGISEQPRVVDGEVVVREILDLTLTVDHNVVDGAPAARFGADLRRLIESAELLRPER